ncbi:MAG: alpha/beta fold hydrolase, partial [Mycobacterium sp.]
MTRDGVPVHFDVYGQGLTTVLLLPTWSIVDSRIWKAQVPFLARHYRVVTFDGRGNGQSGRPGGAHAFTDREFTADALAVLDATATDRAVLVGYSCGAAWAVHVAAAYPQRVQGVFAIAPVCGLPAARLERELRWLELTERPLGWRKYSRHHWLHGGLDDFREFFFAEMFTEPHSTKQIEDMLLWSADVDAQTLVDSTTARLTLDRSLTDIAPSLQCPVHVVHGTADHIRHHAVGAQLADLTGGSLTLIEGAGHGPMTRDPVRLNMMIREFIDSVAAAPSGRTRWTRALRRRRRVLYLSSPIGLGHARRDMAITTELRLARTDLDVYWLAQSPVTRMLEAAEHDLHAFQAIRR